MTPGAGARALDDDAPLNGKQKPIRDAGQAVLRGTLRGGTFEGRWGFGRDAVETARLNMRRAHQEEMCTTAAST